MWHLFYRCYRLCCIAIYAKDIRFVSTNSNWNVDKDYDYIIISGSGVNNYNNSNAGIGITFNDEVELINEFNKTRLGDGEYYTRLTSNIYKNVKVGDKVSIYLGYSSSAIIYGIES